MDSSERLAVSSAATIPRGFYSQSYEVLFSQCWNPGLHGLGLLIPQLFLPIFIFTQTWGNLVHQPLPYHMSSLPWIPISTPPTNLDECFFFNSLVVRLPYSLIFWHFWVLFIYFNWLLSFFWLYEEVKHICLCLHLGCKSQLKLCFKQAIHIKNEHQFLIFICSFIHLNTY